MVVPIRELEVAFIEAMARFAKEVGIIGAMEARLFASLLLADAPQTQDQLMQRLACSRGNVSTALRGLVEAGFVKRVRAAGSRREQYQAEQDLWWLTIGFVLRRIGGQIETAQAEFTRIAAQARVLKVRAPEAAERRAASRLSERVEALASYIKGARVLLDTVRKLVERKKG